MNPPWPSPPPSWITLADRTQRALHEGYWNPAEQLYEPHSPRGELSADEPFHYWWQAHALDALLDAYERTRDERYVRQVELTLNGLLRRNGGRLENDYYDDMLWLALALLRAHTLTGGERFLTGALHLWADGQGGWNDVGGGGIAWRKAQLDYKNTPANAPAVILGARFAQHLGRPGDLEWATKIYHWLRAHLVDPSGLALDGWNRTGDGQVDRDWLFTYNQGTLVGAALKLYRCTGNPELLVDARRTALTTAERLVDPTGVLPDEGDGDGGLFKGILVRYLTQLLCAQPDLPAVRSLLMSQGEHLAAHLTDDARCGAAWNLRSHGPVSLSSHLSGVMLFESLHIAERDPVAAIR